MFEGEILHWTHARDRSGMSKITMIGITGLGKNLGRDQMRGCSIGDPDVITQRIPRRIEIAQAEKIQFL